MKIGIDISQIVYEGTGVGRFTKGLVEAVLKYDKKNEWIFFFSSMRRFLDLELKKSIKNKGHKLIKYRVPPTALSVLWNSIHRLRIEKIIGKVDWFITSDWTEPPADSKKATIVHDLTYLRYPETVDQTIKEVQTARLKWVKKESNLIFADSETTKEDLMTFHKIAGKRIKVIYPGVDVMTLNLSEVKKTLKKYNIAKPFILSVGKIEPRKNLKKLIEAYERLNNKNYELLVVGQRGWEEISPPSENIRFLGYVTDKELYYLYKSCFFFIYPSIWEGFGYPVVEAMSQGIPVATSNTSSLKEIGKGAAYLFDPLKTSDILKALDVMINENSLRKKLAAEGRKRAKNFTWKNYYNELIKALEQPNYDYRN